ncbi:hypothetical protein I4U23_003727 [Adineta vaga]|nr:hypothetical protein I4U23_003727 [Adineta vaga]
MRSKLPFTPNSNAIHICDRLYSNNDTFNLFSRVYIDFQPFNQRKISLVDIKQTTIGCSNCHHIQIIQNKLYIIPRPVIADYETRGQSVLMLLKQVTDTFFDIPNTDLFFDIQDFVEPHDVNAHFKVPIFGLTKMNQTKRGLHEDRIVLMPCFSFWSFPETRLGRWPEKLVSIVENAQKYPYETRLSKLLWRGEYKPKRAWIFAETRQYPNNMDIAIVSWIDNNRTLQLRPTNMYKTPEENCNYKYLLHVEGHSYSSRLKYLLLCGSPVIYPMMDYWQEYWYHLLQNGTNIFLVNANNSGKVLDDAVNYLKEHEHIAKEIGHAGQQLVLDYLSEQAVICYWWKLLSEYVKLFEYTPILHPYAIHIDDFLRTNYRSKGASLQHRAHSCFAFILFSLLSFIMDINLIV